MWYNADNPQYWQTNYMIRLCTFVCEDHSCMSWQIFPRPTILHAANIGLIFGLKPIHHLSHTNFLSGLHCPVKWMNPKNNKQIIVIQLKKGHLKTTCLLYVYQRLRKQVCVSGWKRSRISTIPKEVVPALTTRWHWWIQNWVKFCVVLVRYL